MAVLRVSPCEILLTNEGGTQDGGCAESMTDEEWLGGGGNWRCLGWKRDGLRKHDTCPPIPEGLSGRIDLSLHHSREQEGDKAIRITP